MSHTLSFSASPSVSVRCSVFALFVSALAVLLLSCGLFGPCSASAPDLFTASKLCSAVLPSHAPPRWTSSISLASSNCDQRRCLRVRMRLAPHVTSVLCAEFLDMAGELVPNHPGHRCRAKRRTVGMHPQMTKRLPSTKLRF